MSLADFRIRLVELVNGNPNEESVEHPVVANISPINSQLKTNLGSEKPKVFEAVDAEVSAIFLFILIDPAR